MPGYGGLEVCQRLREAPETARIPVLLTVGKLEPFKADEARRVRADGFIVKPFEASELLTALTKLEDKIVPQSQPSRQSRFAKALAGVEEINPSKEFGDKETGWKNRLSIPPPHSKPRESAPDEPPAEVGSVREPVRTPEPARIEEPKPEEEMKSGLEEALLSSLPQDVTAEEIAAIKAAAAAFSAPGNESSFSQQSARHHTEAPTQELVAKAQEQEEASSESFVSESISTVAQVESSAVAENLNPEPVSAFETLPLPETIVPEPQVVEGAKLGDEEVTAALASLAPTNGHGVATAMDREAARWEPGTREQVPVTMAALGATQEFSGPRWIAEAVPLSENEATLILEHEMEKAYAAFAAADAARMSLASSPEADSSLVIEAAQSNSETSSPVESFTNSSSADSAYRGATSNEESVGPEAEVSAVAASSTVDAVSESGVSEVNENLAYAAAASASVSPAEATTNAEAMSQPNPAAESSETAAVASENGGRQGESELAAAWANWKQIRESVIGSQLIGSQLSSQIANTIAEPKESNEVQPESQPDASPATEEETSEISNIVDSVLADLKPKLMAEIARKMGREKKT
jgi:hypothetical protein